MYLFLVQIIFLIYLVKSTTKANNKSIQIDVFNNFLILKQPKDKNSNYVPIDRTFIKHPNSSKSTYSHTFKPKTYLKERYTSASESSRHMKPFSQPNYFYSNQLDQTKLNTLQKSDRHTQNHIKKEIQKRSKKKQLYDRPTKVASESIHQINDVSNSQTSGQKWDSSSNETNSLKFNNSSNFTFIAYQVSKIIRSRTTQTARSNSTNTFEPNTVYYLVYTFTIIFFLALSIISLWCMKISSDSMEHNQLNKSTASLRSQNSSLNHITITSSDKTVKQKSLTNEPSECKMTAQYKEQYIENIKKKLKA